MSMLKKLNLSRLAVGVGIGVGIGVLAINIAPEVPWNWKHQMKHKLNLNDVHFQHYRPDKRFKEFDPISIGSRCVICGKLKPAIINGIEIKIAYDFIESPRCAELRRPHKDFASTFGLKSYSRFKSYHFGMDKTMLQSCSL